MPKILLNVPMYNKFGNLCSRSQYHASRVILTPFCCNALKNVLNDMPVWQTASCTFFLNCKATGLVWSKLANTSGSLCSGIW